MAYSPFGIQSFSRPDSFRLDPRQAKSCGNMSNDVKISFVQLVLMTRSSSTATENPFLSTSSKGRSNKSGNTRVCIAKVVPAASLASDDLRHTSKVDSLRIRY